MLVHAQSIGLALWFDSRRGVRQSPVASGGWSTENWLRAVQTAILPPTRHWGVADLRNAGVYVNTLDLLIMA